jgi:hypothetical protein
VRSPKWIVAAVLAVGMSAVQLATASLAGAAIAPPRCGGVRGAELAAGSVLNPGECLQSYNGSYQLIMQTDGNLVLYRTSNWSPCWASSWERNNQYYRGDKMFFSVLTIGYYSESKIIVAPTRGDYTPSYGITYSDTRPPGVPRSYTASLSNSGQFWVGWDLHRSC